MQSYLFARMWKELPCDGLEFQMTKHFKSVKQIPGSNPGRRVEHT